MGRFAEQHPVPHQRRVAHAHKSCDQAALHSAYSLVVQWDWEIYSCNSDTSVRLVKWCISNLLWCISNLLWCTTNGRIHYLLISDNNKQYKLKMNLKVWNIKLITTHHKIICSGTHPQEQLRCAEYGILKRCTSLGISWGLKMHSKK